MPESADTRQVMLQETFQHWAATEPYYYMEDARTLSKKRPMEDENGSMEHDGTQAQPAKRLHLVEQQLSTLALGSHAQVHAGEVQAGLRDPPELSFAEQQQLYERVQHGIANGSEPTADQYHQINKFLQLVHFESLQRRGHPPGLPR